MSGSTARLPTAIQIGLMPGFALQDGDKLAELISEAGTSGGGSLPLTGGTLTGPLQTATVGFNGATPVGPQTVTGAKDANEALASLIAALVAVGLIVDNTTA